MATYTPNDIYMTFSEALLQFQKATVSDDVVGREWFMQEAMIQLDLIVHQRAVNSEKYEKQVKKHFAVVN